MLVYELQHIVLGIDFASRDHIRVLGYAYSKERAEKWARIQRESAVRERGEFTLNFEAYEIELTSLDFIDEPEES